jgi:protein CpxP
MKLSIRAFGGLAFAASLACVSTIALAQATGDVGRAPPTAEQREAWKQQHEARLHEAMEAHAKRLHDILNLRPDQDAALHAFIAAMAPPRHEGMMMRDKPEDMATLTTPQRLDRMAARMAEHQTEFQNRAAAIRQFYAALSPEQQRAFDALPPMMEHDHHGGMGRHGMAPGHMGHDGPGPQ